MSELPLSDQAIVRLADRVAARHPDDVALLERLVRIPSVSGPDPDSEALAPSAQAVADELDAARLDWVRIVDATCSADFSTNTTDELRERICAPYGPTASASPATSAENSSRPLTRHELDVV